MTVKELQSFIGGQWRGGGDVTPDINPSRPSEVLAEVRGADSGLAGEAVRAARSAFSTWRSMPAPARGEILRRAADLLEQQVDTVGRDLAREEGKALFEAVGETRRAIAILRYYAGQTLEPDGETYPSATAATLLFARREPIGVIAAITPFNFPIAIPAWKIAPALAYGNTVVWKPAETVPLTAAHFVEALSAAGLPEGVLNLVLGKGAGVGSTIAQHPEVDAITFTGSNGVGQAIARGAVEQNKKVQLEMGGKNPAVVLRDAELDLAVDMVTRGAFLSAGQKCTATSRVIVEQPVVQEFADRLSQAARDWPVGDPLEADVKTGPLVSEDQLQTVLRYLDIARGDGGNFLVGGGRINEMGDGYFVQPTVVADLPLDSRAVREEIFGPVVTLITAHNYQEAVSLANDTPFGLSASVFTRDLGKAMRFASDIRAGVVKVNQESAGLEYHVPFGGMKNSSSGSREQGKVARDFFTQWKTVYIDPPATDFL